MSLVLLGFGANVEGEWGCPKATFARALQMLERNGIHIHVRSRLYRSEAVAAVAQPDYLNCVVRVRCAFAPGRLLHLVKSLERSAGRRRANLSGNRPLDIDILDFDGRVLGWPPPRGPRPPSRLILPHPNLHQRAFVLLPLQDVAPRWHHPVFKCAPRWLAMRLGCHERIEALDYTLDL